MREYPKIKTLYTRDEETHKVTSQIRCPEFKNIKNWLITEKIDGTNIRVIYDRIAQKIDIKGRTGKAQIPKFLFEKLQTIFPIEKFQDIFSHVNVVCLYGEGYGERINKGGNYRKGVSFRLFDIWIDNWWLQWDNIIEIADSLGIKTVPCLGIMEIEKAISLIGMNSKVALEENAFDIVAEGIVATSYPLMLFRNGNPVKWKLKKKDF